MPSIGSLCVLSFYSIIFLCYNRSPEKWRFPALSSQGSRVCCCLRPNSKLLPNSLRLPDGQSLYCVSFGSLMYCRLDTRWEFHRQLPIFCGDSNPALAGNWPIRLTPSHKMAANFCFRTYDWFTYIPITFREII